ncbi:endonuclease/exonuclease/phosphatase family protein [Sphingomonas sp. JC676]|uniref:endonuclease/exonuclease/phosphatase family protein n=1 Tax=Sphingomonas sp. JC676 TaxID=2768065 RepID=UPI0016580D81|nr:endonuclease/exonuclease/phosphatase family protein [Sphingomonas sp. JC676]MBC9034128.1 endonuclease/exonuclease/phosphatase family protein [Sphingomonas sp. JC676]
MSNMYSRIYRDFDKDSEGAKHCADRILKIRARLAPLRDRKCDATLLLATWNIRDFDSNKFGFGPRRAESFYYIAEMISCFDLVAVQEVNRDLRALERVVAILGREWDYIATDTTEGPGGNGERMAFVFNREKVFFRKIAGEIVLPDGQLIVAQKKVKTPKDQPVPVPAPALEEKKVQFARSPFLVAFQSGWFRFSLCTAHLYYGAASGPALDQRIAEIAGLVKFFADRQDAASKQEKDSHGAVENYIILGDFNVVSPEHKTMKALKSNGFVVPDAIDGAKVRKLGDHFYDQIAVRMKDSRFKVTGGGMIDIFEDVFTDADLPHYQDVLPKSDPEEGSTSKAKTPEAIYKKWRTWQMSDHHPLWIEIATDFSEDYLAKLAANGTIRPDMPT